MDATHVITAPIKLEVVFNSIGSEKSITATLCVSSRATDVTISRTSIAPRNNITQNTKRKPQRKRPISEVLDNLNSKELRDNKAEALSIMNQANSRVPHANGSGCHEQFEHQSSISVLVTPFSQLKRIKVESMTSSKSRLVLASDASRITKDNQKNISVSAAEKAPMNLCTQYQNSESTNLPPQISILRAVQVSYRRSEAGIHNNKPVRTHTNQLSNQQPVPLHTPGLEKFPSPASASKSMQLQHQNQQLHSENMILQKQLSLFRQLIKNPQRLNQVLTRLDQGAH